MVNAVFLFPGQGAQYPRMAMDLLESGSPAVKELFALASEASGKDMAAFLRDCDEETLKRTDVSQGAITLANLAAATVLKERGIVPALCAGFSLGEYAALATSEVLSLKDCFSLVTARGAAMQRSADALAGQGTPPGMAAVLGLPPEAVESLIKKWTAAGLEGLYAANFNSSSQVVVAGTAAALAEATTRFKEAGAKRVLPLKVAGPFHSPLVADAAKEFAAVLETTEFSAPQTALFSNVTGAQVRSGEEARKLALRQITEPVRWTAELSAIFAEAELRGARIALEVGPGKVLQGLWKSAEAPFPCATAGTLADIDAAVSSAASA